MICAVSELQQRGVAGSRKGQALPKEETPSRSVIGAGGKPPVGKTGTVTLLASAHLPDGIFLVLPSPSMG